MILSPAECRVLLKLHASITDYEEALLNMMIPAAQAAVSSVLGYDPEHATRKELLPTIGSQHVAESDEWRSDGSLAYRASQGIGIHDNLLYCKFVPVRSVTSLYEDSDARHGKRSGAFATQLVEGTGFVPEYDQFDSDGNELSTSGILRRIGTTWPTLPGTVKVEYVAGYTRDELNGLDGQINARPIKDAISLTFLKSYRQYVLLGKDDNAGFTTGSLIQEKLGDYSYQTQTTKEVAAMTSMSVELPPEARLLLQPFINYGAFYQ